jgi:hypothetical protein
MIITQYTKDQLQLAAVHIPLPFTSKQNNLKSERIKGQEEHSATALDRLMQLVLLRTGVEKFLSLPFCNLAHYKNSRNSLTQQHAWSTLLKIW